MSWASKQWNLWHYSGSFSDPRQNVPTEPSPFSACALWRQGYRESGQICCGETDVTVGSQLQILLHRNRIVRSVQPSTHSPPVNALWQKKHQWHLYRPARSSVLISMASHMLIKCQCNLHQSQLLCVAPALTDTIILDYTFAHQYIGLFDQEHTHAGDFR